MNVQNMPIDKIRPYNKNPRKNEKAIPEVAKSLKEFGWQQPLVVDSNMVLIVGHTRYSAAISLGFTEVPVLVATDLSPQQVKAYRIMDNRTGEISKWDHDLLLAELDSIALEEPMYNHDFIGFAVDSIDEPTELKKWDTSDVQDEFIITIRGPLTIQDEVVEIVKELADCTIEVSHVKRPKHGEDPHTNTITKKIKEA